MAMDCPALDGEPLVEAREGLARLCVPDPKRYLRPDGVYEPAWAPVFYNPRMAFNRDVAVVFLRAWAKLRGVDEPVVVEPLAGSGVRAVRYALEAGAGRVYAVDIDPVAVRLAEINIEVNKVADRVYLAQGDANAFLHTLRSKKARVHLVDLDPFGSPAPFIEASLAALRGRGVLAATATDTAPLTGTHPAALRRRYDVVPGRSFLEKEQAVRILAGYIIRRAASREYGAKVLLAYYADYYVRVYVELVPGARRADKSLESLAYLAFCPKCGIAWYASKPWRPGGCPRCGSQPQLIGPVYAGPLCDEKLVDEMIRVASEASWLSNQARTLELLRQLREECGLVNPHYRVDKVASVLKVNMPSPRLVVEELRRLGYRATLTHFDKRGVRSDAPPDVIYNVVWRLSPSNAG
ncbi:N2,N2-dimethylguanosine tRNA methyltransferase [Pyrolobus fumarii 1A]|uniref:tRNA (guanine(26)-N(2))-dimethyltransferase n=1 Tax=Pyrolobus fumarii (strain DSM 11204 / 1A) TaxID=694429 RepID=G0EGX8_PYRF1|nr:tRNA (guanine(10)-N(2))-dimethyltransferase [Pyrolobus fumarii]AEM38428.1 N2,N2-dimethylguanosine tRNA methyltransferase [Pyrolobus fumarii 1A]